MLAEKAPTKPHHYPEVSVLQDYPQPKAHPTRLDYLDGLRGIAALAVVILHAFEMFGLGLEPLGIHSNGLLTGQGIERLIPLAFDNVFQFGAFAVQVFIVISGYSLMLGVVRSGTGMPKGGLGAYFKRRVSRIWPPYYAAVLTSLLIIAFVPGMNTKSNMYWDLALPATPDGILSHFLFLQYLQPEWFFKINPPMWTVALEEHIYVVFPFVLLPLWRRFGTRALAVLGLLGSIVFWYLLSSRFEGANFWFVGLFSMGAAGAAISFSDGERERRWRERVPWGKLAVLFIVGFVVLVHAQLRIDSLARLPVWLKDVVLGAGTACLLVHYTEKWKANEFSSKPGFFRFLRAAPVVELGVFSYSLYLMHAPILAVIALMIRDAGITSVMAYVLIIFVGIPITVLCCYLFHRVFERPFMPVSARSSGDASGFQGHQRRLGFLRRVNPVRESGSS